MHIENVPQKERRRNHAQGHAHTLTHAQCTVQEEFDRMRIGLKSEASLSTLNEWTFSWFPVSTERKKMQLAVDLVHSWVREVQVCTERG